MVDISVLELGDEEMEELFAAAHAAPEPDSPMSFRSTIDVEKFSSSVTDDILKPSADAQKQKTTKLWKKGLNRAAVASKLMRADDSAEPESAERLSRRFSRRQSRRASQAGGSNIEKGKIH